MWTWEAALGESTRKKSKERRQWRQGGQEEQLAEARIRKREWVWQGGEKTEDDEAEHRERQGNDGGGQGGEEKEEGTDMDHGEETVDDKMSEDSDVRGRRGDWGHLYGPERCTGCQENPFECGCLDVNFESKGARSRREKRERERADWNLKGQVGLPGLEVKGEEFGRGRWGSEVGSWYQDQWWDSGAWRRNPRRKGQAVWKNVGVAAGENEGRWRRSGRKGGRGSETKTTPSEVQQMLNWCEEEAALATAKGSEEIQAEKEARRKR